MVGFPTETRAEARATVDFLVNNSDVIREVSLQTFHIDEVAETYQHPERFGLTIVDDPDLDIELYHDYVAETGMTQTEAAELFEEMMSRLRANLPLFAGDNIFYFMQKSHYFLHLAADVKPDEFVARCRERVERRAKLGPDATLAPSRDLRVVELPFSHTETRTKLAHPLARAIQPDFLTGSYVENRVAEAERALGTIAPNPVSSRASIGWTLARPATVRLEIVDVAGRRVARLEAGDRPAGAGALAGDGRADDGRRLPGGVYFARLFVDAEAVGAARLVLVR